MRTRRWTLPRPAGRGGWWLALAAVLLAGCGKKGPPLAPLVRVPRPVAAIEARRVGREVYVTFTVPAQNADGMAPADVRRVDVLAISANAPPAPQRFLREGSRVASVPVAPAAREAGAGADQASPRGPLPGETVQGAMVTIRDTLTPEDLAAVPPVATGASPAGDAAAAPAPGGPQRFYTAYAVSERGRSSAAGGVASVPLGAAPDRPAGLTVAYTGETLTLTWSPLAGVDGYNVYVEPGAPPERPRGAPADQPRPANASRLDAAEYAEPVRFGAARCFRVGALSTAGASIVESEPSEPACIAPVDTFPPSAPGDLTAVALDGGVIELRWEPSPDPDVAGYLVLRGAPDAPTLRPITETPVREPRFVDRGVTAGQRYVYAVVAVDSADPPNLSPESGRDDATARP